MQEKRFSAIFGVVRAAPYVASEASFWTVEEIDLAQDMKDWESLNLGEQHFIKFVLAFFAASDGIVIENLAAQFSMEVQIPEAAIGHT